VSGGPLAGVRVVDLTTVVVGPICTRTLADYGADVIKVEAPGGDLLRTMAEGSRQPGMSGKFINFNRNKRSIVLDLKKPDGHAALLRLIARADVFVSNVRPEALARAGLDHATLAKDNPRLIHCSILAFGRGGRYFNRPAYDPVIQSLSGVAGTLARATGEPRFVPMVMSDHTSGLIAAQCIGFALYRREKTGQGEAIDVPMLENMASFVASEHLGAATFDPPVGPTGDGRLLSPNYRPLPTKDGYITIRPNTNAQAFAPLQQRRGADEKRRRLFRGPQGGACAKDDGRMGRTFRQARRSGGALQFDRRPADRSASQGCRILQGRGSSVARPPPAHAACQHFLRRRAGRRDPRPADGRADPRDPGRSGLHPGRDRGAVGRRRRQLD
jgi:crotonobetainyl-CoA:carnitine CoA-transferase CaiB-like acyl-CoA transferase